jgi:hypothetical protein
MIDATSCEDTALSGRMLLGGPGTHSRTNHVGREKNPGAEKSPRQGAAQLGTPRSAPATPLRLRTPKTL